MRLEAASGGETKVWLTDEDVEDVLERLQFGGKRNYGIKKSYYQQLIL